MNSNDLIDDKSSKVILSYFFRFVSLQLSIGSFTINYERRNYRKVAASSMGKLYGREFF